MIIINEIINLRIVSFCCFCCVLLQLCACSNRAARVDAPQINVAEASSNAILQFDKNGDNVISGSELQANSALANLDTNRDGSLSEQEIADVLRQWQESKLAIIDFKAFVTYRGKPLAGASVEFTPEEFLANGISPAVGVTDNQGIATLSIPKEELPNPNMRGGVRLGIYKVSVSKKNNGRESLPEKYNTSTAMGHIISPDSLTTVQFNL